MPNFAANLSMMSAEHAFLDRSEAVADDGYLLNRQDDAHELRGLNNTGDPS